MPRSRPQLAEFPNRQMHAQRLSGPVAIDWPLRRGCNTYRTLAGPTILFDYVFKVLDLTDLDARLTFGIVAFDPRYVDAVPVDRDLLRLTDLFDRLAQEPRHLCNRVWWSTGSGAPQSKAKALFYHQGVEFARNSAL